MSGLGGRGYGIRGLRLRLWDGDQRVGDGRWSSLLRGCDRDSRGRRCVVLGGKGDRVECFVWIDGYGGFGGTSVER